MKFLRFLAAWSCLSTLLIAAPAAADEADFTRAEGAELYNAVAHYARSRALLLAAIRAFDEGTKLANPNALLDSAEWRSNLVERAKDLEILLDPQPRVSNGGVRFEAQPSLLGGSE